MFIAGHRYNDPRSGYQFLSTNVRIGESDNFASSSLVSWPVLVAIQAAKGRRLLLVDTCHSGSAFNARRIKDASDGGVVAISATNTQQDAVELPSGMGCSPRCWSEACAARPTSRGEESAAFSISE